MNFWNTPYPPSAKLFHEMLARGISRKFFVAKIYSSYTFSFDVIRILYICPIETCCRSEVVP